MKLSYALSFDVGKVRTNNEDNFYCNGFYRKNVAENSGSFTGKAKANFFLAAVCDGMGGEKSGEIASLMAVQNLTSGSLPAISEIASDTVQAANDAICAAMREKGQRMGSTITALYIDQNTAVPVNLGDSRIYLYRDNNLTQLTSDHCKSESLVRLGLLTAEQARVHPSKHELTQYLGIFPDEMLIEPDIGTPLPLRPGDIFLLCSDGLTDMVDDAAIASTLASSGSAGNMAKSLLEQALNAGGHDNVTVLVVQVLKPLLSRLFEK